MIIKINDLYSACPRQVELARQTFGDIIDVTAENIRLAVQVGLDINWAVKKLTLFQPIRDDYEAKYKPIWDDYEAKYKPIWNDYEAKRKLIWDDYEEKCGEILIDLLDKKI